MPKYFYTYVFKNVDSDNEFLQSFAAYNIDNANKSAEVTANVYGDTIKGLFESNDPSIQAKDQLCNEKGE